MLRYRGLLRAVIVVIAGMMMIKSILNSNWPRTIASESQAAVVGGTTTVMDMPNVQPPTLTLPALEQKYQLANQGCATNYSFYLGASADNLEQIKRLDQQTCGVKIFVGSSTGQMQIDDPDVLAAIFRLCYFGNHTRCESDAIIAENFRQMQARCVEHVDAPSSEIRMHKLVMPAIFGC